MKHLNAYFILFIGFVLVSLIIWNIGGLLAKIDDKEIEQREFDVSNVFPGAE